MSNNNRDIVSELATKFADNTITFEQKTKDGYSDNMDRKEQP